MAERIGEREADLQRLALIAEMTGAGGQPRGVKRILQMDAENDTLRAEVRRLRRNLAQTEHRNNPNAGGRRRDVPGRNCQ